MREHVGLTLATAAPLPWRMFQGAGVVAIFDANDKEIVHWTGFDASKVPKHLRGELANLIVSAVNALSEAPDA